MRRHFAAVLAAVLLACATGRAPRPPAELPFELAANHIYLPVAVGQHAPSSFMLDTGAQFTAIAQTTADALGLVAGAHGQARGAGPAVVETTLIRDVDLDVAGVPLHLPRLPGLPLTEVSLAEGRPIEGLLGENVLRDYAVEIDYARRIVRFHDPSTFVAPPGAIAVPITFIHNQPVIAAELTLRDGRVLPMRMMVDTGAGGAVLVNRPFAEKHAIYDAIAPAIEGPFGVGIGGASTSRIGRAARFAVAGFTFDAPLVAASMNRAGAVALRDVDGLIGAEILRRFTVTLDSAHRRLLLAPNATLHAPFEVETSGAGFKAADLKFDRVLVRYVLPNSPAAEAGLQVGDEIVSARTVGALRPLFAEPGKRIALRVRRGGREFEAVIVTRRLV